MPSYGYLVATCTPSPAVPWQRLQIHYHTQGGRHLELGYTGSYLCFVFNCSKIVEHGWQNFLVLFPVPFYEDKSSWLHGPACKSRKLFADVLRSAVGITHILGKDLWWVMRTANVHLFGLNIKVVSVVNLGLCQTHCKQVPDFSCPSKVTWSREQVIHH